MRSRNSRFAIVAINLLVAIVVSGQTEEETFESAFGLTKEHRDETPLGKIVEATELEDFGDLTTEQKGDDVVIEISKDEAEGNLKDAVESQRGNPSRMSDETGGKYVRYGETWRYRL